MGMMDITRAEEGAMAWILYQEFKPTKKLLPNSRGMKHALVNPSPPLNKNIIIPDLQFTFRLGKSSLNLATGSVTKTFFSGI